MNVYLIVNPLAGGVAGDADLAVLRDEAKRRGVQVEVTDLPGEAERLAREAAQRGAQVIVAAGGDGTVSEVVNGLAHHLASVRLVIVPMGTANDFATTLGLPTGDLGQALAALDGRERRVDLIRASMNGGRLIINAATGGFSNVVHGKLTPQMKQAWGPLAYLRAALDAAPEMCFHRAGILLDNETITVDTCAVVVANGRSAGGMTLTPEAEVDDAALDVLIVTAQAFLEQIRLAAQYVAGTHLDSQHITFRRVRQVSIDSKPSMRFSSDGELIGESPISFAVLPQTLRVLVPEAAPGASS